MIIVFLVVYTDDKVNECIRRLNEISDILFPAEEIKYIVADTSRQDKTILDGNVVYLYPGNDGREFGGWEACQSYMISDVSTKSQDKVIVANDTFYSNYGDEYLKGFVEQPYNDLDEGRAIFGYMDSFPKKVRIDSNEFDSWVRTSFFITNVRTLMSIDLFGFPYKKEQFFETEGSFFIASDFISDNYKRYLGCWLFEDEEDDEFNVKWHSAEILTSENRCFMQAKAMCIFSEHYLTWGAKHHGVKIIKVNK